MVIEITCLKELLVTLDVIRTHMVQGIISIWYVAARKIVVVVQSQVKIWSWSMSYKHCHPTLLCLPHHFGTILTLFTKFKYYFDFGKSTITLQPPWNEELCHFPILIEKYRVFQLLWWKKSPSSWRSFRVFSLPNLTFYCSILWKEVHQ